MVSDKEILMQAAEKYARISRVISSDYPLFQYKLLSPML